MHFPTDAPDDVWLPIVGEWGWTIVGHDSKYHLRTPELDAIKRYGIGCFYLWGSHAKRWEKLQCFARAYDRMVAAEMSTPKPFIYRVSCAGRLTPISIP